MPVVFSYGYYLYLCHLPSFLSLTMQLKYINTYTLGRKSLTCQMKKTKNKKCLFKLLICCHPAEVSVTHFHMMYQTVNSSETAVLLMMCEDSRIT